ncbi:MAG: hypothetical protein E5X48_30520 [Mesorhizobium sp.]|uniref:rhamnosyltransferase WsaF family glycosyltransferase n=1 Tax=Mesorhizobium sp. TaxID=1871066 RepID=UPI00120C9C22|nr:hypothetical protein [Mesorhizobium sp.]TIQ29126.1 MAG: hypothetical protein E5X48_30520 [Mesorhizobium sp.]
MNKMLNVVKEKVARPIWRRLPKRVQTQVRGHLPAEYGRNGYFHVMSPFNAQRDPGERTRVTMIMPSVHKDHLTGGPATLANFMVEIKARFPQYDLRILPVMVPFTGGKEDLAKSLSQFDILQGADIEKGQDATYSVISDAAYKGFTLPVRRNEVFVASMWPTFFLAKALQRKQEEFFGAFHSIQYIIQDYEPLALFAWSDFYLMARQTYEDSKSTIALVATKSLSEYLDRAGHHFIAKYVFDPAQNAVSIRSADLRQKKETFIVYGRPDTPRNCFDLIFEALLKVTGEHPSIAERFKFVSVGTTHPSYRLRNGALLECRGFMPPEAYKELTLGAAAGIYFVVSPHTGYVGLELARGGALVISNSFETKIIRDLHPNIREPEAMTVDGVASAIVTTIQEFWRDSQAGLRAARADLEAREANSLREENFPFLEQLFERQHGFGSSQ